MVGRSPELAQVQAAHQDSLAGVPSGVVVSGEAGIGKTRLLHEFFDGLDRDVVVAVGQCVELGAFGAPFGAVRGALRGLIAGYGLDAVLDAEGPTRRHALTLLLSGPAEDSPLGVTADQVHEAIADLLVDLSQRAPVVVAVEDLHWADTATLALLAALVRTIRTGRIMLALTYRSDDVTREHPLRPFLAELGRARRLRRIDLERLGRQDVATQVSSIRGVLPEDDLIDTVLRRSDGVPFLVEEVLALDAGRTQLPDSLRDLVLARYDAMSESTRGVLRLLATGGIRVRHDVLEAVHDGDRPALEQALREAVAASILSVDDHAYRFRHALTREAIDGELLPGERSRFHARFAVALTERAGPGHEAEIAHHWYGANDLPRAFGALLLAADQARATGAVASAGDWGEQALDLWDEVPDAEERAGRRRVELVLEIVPALGETSDGRALALLQRELDSCPPEDHTGRALLLHEMVVIGHSGGEGGQNLAAGRALAERAHAELQPPRDDHDRAARVRVTCGLGILLGMAGDRGAASLLEEAASGARELLARPEAAPVHGRARFELARALTNLGSLRGMQGDVEGALEAFDEGQSATPDPAAVLRSAGFRLHLLLSLGRFQEVCDRGARALSLAEDAGLFHGWAGWLAVFVMEAHLALGELDRADRMAERFLGRRPAAFVRSFCHQTRLMVLVHRDNLDEATAYHHTHEESLTAGLVDSEDASVSAHNLGRFALVTGNLSDAWSWVETAGEAASPAPGAAGVRVVTLGAEVLAARRRAGLSRVGSEPDAVAESRLREALAALDVWDVVSDWRALFEAHLAGPEGTGTDVAAWRSAAAAAGQGRVPVQLRTDALFRLGEVQLAAGDRDGAAATLTGASALALAVEDLHTARRVAELQHRGRLNVASPRSGDDLSVELTHRERQVLELVTEGLTNREIGQRLFISDKTASVHVSAILRKLGVSSRTEAAVRAASGSDPGRGTSSIR